MKDGRRANDGGSDWQRLREADPISDQVVAAYLDGGAADRIAAAMREAPARVARTDRHPASGRILRIAALAGLGAVLLVSAAAILRDDGSSERGTTFSSFAAIAAEQPKSEIQHVAWEFRWVGIDNGIDREIELWAGSDQRYERRSFSVRGESTGSDEIYDDRAAGFSCIASSPERAPDCRRVSFDQTGGGLMAADDYWFEPPGLPTEPEALQAAFDAEIQSDTESGISESPPSTGPDSGQTGFGPSGAWTELDPEIQASITAEETFSRAVAYLSNPFSPPELRAALFELLADTDGVELSSDHEDRLGRPAAVIGFARPWPFDHPRPPIGWNRYELYVDPSTTEVLELRTLEAPPRGTESRAVPRDEDYGVYSYELFTKRRPADALPPEAARFVDAIVEAKILTPIEEAIAAFAEGPASPAPLQGADVVLSEGGDWLLTVTNEQALELSGPGYSAGSSGYTRPITLNEASAYKVSRDGEPLLLVAGPVFEYTAEVIVETADGGSAEASVVDAHGLRWFWVEMELGRVNAITARDEDGEIVDEYTQPLMPPPYDPGAAVPAGLKRGDLPDLPALPEPPGMP